ncbi:chitin-binding domain-containing protein [Streptomyces microflavus]|uniref:Chitin-binding domain-containing protein n=1 Tax=Streptomyces microflavus TaxID=1919 RepID=A0ABV1QEN5_STRMI
MKARFLSLPTALALATSALLFCPAAYAGEAPGAPADISAQCPESGAIMIADPDNERGYYQCVDGTAHKKVCLGPDSIFEPGTQACKDAPITVQCPETGASKIAHPDDRHMYYECFDGTAYKRTCPQQLAFDPETRTCEFG